jgi:dihydropteroate synthase
MSAKDTVFYKKNTINCRGKIHGFTRPCVMGILNLTPDSFYGPSRVESERDIISKAEKMIAEGAEILDIGAESTRPGASPLDVSEELKRLIPFISLIRKEFPETLISVDTYKAKVAAEAVDKGADIINDISGGTLDEEMFKAVAQLKVPYILTHIQGNPQNMQQSPYYDNIVIEVIDYFAKKTEQLKTIGVSDIILDPGFGFGKNLEHNYILLNKLEHLKVLGYPVIAGVSRKRMINQVIGSTPDTALNGTTVVNTIALLNGAEILRVHDVKEATEAVKIITFAKNLK